ncbi:MAG TPA: hypothetical protein VJM10_02485 [Candidatus Methylomirabilis sp.]|nr:hypothetical protein [Candidatus Methylomirabilis sp.]
MLPNTKALLSFAGRFLLIFFLMLPLWFFFTPAYNRLLASGTNLLLPLIEDPHVTTLVGWKHNIGIVRSGAPLTTGIRIQGFTGYLTHFNLILMVALVLAPRQIEWRRRGKILAIALGTLSLIHLLYLLIGVKFFQQPELEAFQSSAGRFYVWGTNFYLSVASQLLPVLIWMVLYRAIDGNPGKGDTFEKENAPQN